MDASCVFTKPGLWQKKNVCSFQFTSMISNDILSNCNCIMIIELLLSALQYVHISYNSSL